MQALKLLFHLGPYVSFEIIMLIFLTKKFTNIYFEFILNTIGYYNIKNYLSQF